VSYNGILLSGFNAKSTHLWLTSTKVESEAGMLATAG
jgi:hypothetical protein